jgi:uncharacterized membrane protein SpoIIM required for sporulation
MIGAPSDECSSKLPGLTTQVLRMGGGNGVRKHLSPRLPHGLVYVVQFALGVKEAGGPMAHSAFAIHPLFDRKQIRHARFRAFRYEVSLKVVPRVLRVIEIARVLFQVLNNGVVVVT